MAVLFQILVDPKIYDIIIGKHYESLRELVNEHFLSHVYRKGSLIVCVITATIGVILFDSNSRAIEGVKAIILVRVRNDI